MKKRLALLLTAAMMLSIAGCGAASGTDSSAEAEATETTAATEETDHSSTTGGWTVNEDLNGQGLPQEVATAYAAAAETYTDGQIDPIAYLGSQVVSGTNYACLCEVTSQGKSTLAVVIVYEDLQGNAEVTSVKEFKLADYAGQDKDIPEGNVEGGWTVDDQAAACQLPEGVQTAFDASTKDLTEISYTPIAYLGSQVVSGSNYALLCVEQDLSDRDSTPRLTVLTIYDGVDGTQEISHIAGVDLADFTD